MRTSEPRRRVAGFTYLGLLLAVALLGVALAAVGEVWRTTLQRERERELLFVGDAFRTAIAAYYEGTPGGGAKQFPKTLEDLLLDRRYPAVRRYLRKVHADPLTGKPEWGLIKGPGESIMGVHSLSQGVPVKRANFPDEYDNFSVSKTYVDWKFVYSQTAPVTSGAPGQTANTGALTRGGPASRFLIPSSSVLTPLVPPGQNQPAQTFPQNQSSPLQPAAPGTPPTTSTYQRLDIPSSTYQPSNGGTGTP